MHFGMQDRKNLSKMSRKQNQYDENWSMSSVSSIGVNSSFDSSVFEQEKELQPNSRSSVSPTSVILDGPQNPNLVRTFSEDSKNNAKIINDENREDLLNKSDEWTSRTGIGTQKTALTGVSFYTGYTNTTGTTKLHKNGVSAVLHRKLRRNNSCKVTGDHNPVPKSINTIRRPMNFDCKRSSERNNIVDLLAPSKVDGRGQYQRKLFTKSKLKQDPATRLINDECYCLNNNDVDSNRSADGTVLENGDYHAGSNSFAGFFRSFFLCCNAESVL